MRMAQALDLLIVGFLFGVVAHGGHGILSKPQPVPSLWSRHRIYCPRLSLSRRSSVHPSKPGVLPSDLTIVPVSRSPFLSVTWSGITLPAKKHNIPVTHMLRRTIVLLCLNFTYAMARGLLGNGAGLLFLASYPAKSVKSTGTISRIQSIKNHRRTRGFAHFPFALPVYFFLPAPGENNDFTPSSVRLAAARIRSARRRLLEGSGAE